MYRQLDSGERNCISVCAEKYMAHMARVGARFAEETMPQAQPQGAGAGNAGG